MAGGVLPLVLFALFHTSWAACGCFSSCPACVPGTGCAQCGDTDSCCGANPRYIQYGFAGGQGDCAQEGSMCCTDRNCAAALQCRGGVCARPLTPPPTPRPAPSPTPSASPGPGPHATPTPTPGTAPANPTTPPHLSCQAWGYGAEDCGQMNCASCQAANNKACDYGNYFDKLTENPRGYGYCASSPWTSSQWVDTCHDLDAIRVTPGCSFEVATEAHGGGQRYTFHSDVRVCGNEVGCDRVRSIRVFGNTIWSLGLLRLYICDEGTGSTAFDSSESSAHATLHGAAASLGSTWQQQNINGVMRTVMFFDQNGYAKASAAGLPGGRAARTIMAWVKPVRGSGNGPFGYGKGNCNNAYYTWIQDGTRLNLDQWCQEEGVNPVIADLQDRWYHLALAYDGHTNVAYVDGKLHARGTPDSPPNTQVGGDAQVVMGGNPALSADYRGLIADFAIFSRALSDTEVARIYESGPLTTVQTCTTSCPAAGFTACLAGSTQPERTDLHTIAQPKGHPFCDRNPDCIGDVYCGHGHGGKEDCVRACSMGSAVSSHASSIAPAWWPSKNWSGFAPCLLLWAVAISFANR